LPDSPYMRQTAAPRSSHNVLDQWGIQFPLLPEDLAGLSQPTPSSLSLAISSWRLSLPTWPPRHGDALDQWGIEFPLAYDELTAFGTSCRGGRSRARTSAILDGRLRGISSFGAYAAIVAIVVAGSASVVPSIASAGAPPTRNVPVIIFVADPVRPVATANPTLGPTPSPTLATPQPSATSNPTLGPTPSATLPAQALSLKPVSSIPVAAVVAALPLQAASTALPTVQDARNYLVARLGARVDPHWGLSQSQCASLIIEYESRWDPHATNVSSGAYGLPQADPASKLANWAKAQALAADKAGDAETARLYRAWRDNPVVQAEWGVDYMIRRYGSPCGALAFRSGYWDGEVLVPGVGWY
jgi:hypothetical protein